MASGAARKRANSTQKKTVSFSDRTKRNWSGAGVGLASGSTAITIRDHAAGPAGAPGGVSGEQHERSG
jgi:hypothetical protein